MRLGDLDSVEQKVKAKSDWLFDSGEPILSGAVMAVCGIIHNQPSIDPESLPIVQQLRAEIKRLNDGLKRVTAERDAAQTLLGENCGATGTGPIRMCFGYPLDKVQRLVQADREGRCVVIPDFVWKIGETQGVVKVPYRSWMGRFIGTKFYKTEKEAAEAALEKGDQ